MNARALLHWAAQHDIRMSANGDRLHVDALKGVLTDQLKAMLTAVKPDLLRLLRRSETTGPEITVADLPGDWRVEWEERAAIREYDGGQGREHAEAEALREIIARMRDAGELPTVGVEKS